MSAHRYWRIYIEAPANYMQIAEIQLRESDGGADQTGSGTATASGYWSDTWLPSKAVDDDTGTAWHSANDVLPHWWAYDFGSGVTKDILQITIDPWAAQLGRAPTLFTLEYSDDGTSWVKAWIWNTTWPNANQQVFTIPGPGIYISKANLYVVIQEITFTEQDDGTSSGGLVVGGTDQAYRIKVDPAPDGGLVVGGTDAAPQTTISVDPPSSGGLVVGGSDSAQWSNPWSVAVKGGTYRIGGGAIYTLANTLYFEGLGDIAAIVKLAVPPATPGQFRYDILVIGIDGAIHVVAGAEAATPVMPATTASHVLVKHILRYYGQTRIAQSDIGRNYTAPVVTRVDVSASDDELAWAELTSTLTVNVYDQYGSLYRSNVVINAAFLTGNGTLAPMAASTATGTTTFLYTRGGADPGDKSPIIKFSVATGAAGTVLITLLDAAGNVMT